MQSIKSSCKTLRSWFMKSLIQILLTETLVIPNMMSYRQDSIFILHTSFDPAVMSTVT